ncbi:MAG: hypothetical protein ACOYN2_05140 [Patescibacteria group bacterium]
MDISTYITSAPSYNLGSREIITDTETIYTKETTQNRLAGAKTVGFSAGPSLDLTDKINLQANIGLEKTTTDYADKNHPVARVDGTRNTTTYNIKGTYKLSKENSAYLGYGKTGDSERITAGGQIGNMVSINGYYSKGSNGRASDKGVQISVNIPLGPKNS